MRSLKISPQRKALLKRIEALEKEGKFNVDAEDDPEGKELLPSQADYLCERLKNKIGRRVANFIGDRYFLSQIKRGELVIDGVFGEEYLDVLKKGAVVICNHFSPADNYIVFHAIRKALPKKYLYKVVKEGNYTGFRGLYGLFFRHCNTLPLSRNRRTMMKFTSAVQTLLSRGESILIYPEQSMWRGYKKPRPFQIGAFKIAAKANVPVLPIFITMEDDVSRLDRDGCPLLRHTVHILPPIFSQTEDGERALPKDMLECAETLYKQKYEQVYKTPLVRA